MGGDGWQDAGRLASTPGCPIGDSSPRCSERQRGIFQATNDAVLCDFYAPDLDPSHDATDDELTTR